LARTSGKVAFTFSDLLWGRFPGPRILIYHQIGSGIGRQMEVSIEDFGWQMKWLSEHFHVVDLETAVAQRGAAGSESLVVVSFDDGYEDFYRHGYPVLRERGIPFVLYLTTDPVENRRLSGPSSAVPLNWDQVTDMISSELMTLGVHTHTHPDLRFLDSGAIEVELSASDELIRRRTNIEPRHFAYPWGYWSEPADVLIRQR
jgi:peptidoglycan/xylan/chitin deacetylase (PgdA/CDA1 family)